MIQKMENMGVNLRVIILCLFILLSLFFALFYACDSCEEKTEPSIMVFWPPDMIPHPPHFPNPTPPGKEA